jgi:hypothetical protein
VGQSRIDPEVADPERREHVEQRFLADQRPLLPRTQRGQEGSLGGEGQPDRQA